MADLQFEPADISVEITGDVTARYREASAGYRVSGYVQITNTSKSAGLVFDVGEFPMRIGWRLMRSGTFVKEGRVPFRQGTLQPGSRARVPLAIDIGVVEGGRYTIMITVVREKKYWLNQKDPSFAFRCPLNIESRLTPFDYEYWNTFSDAVRERPEYSGLTADFLDCLQGVNFVGHFRQAVLNSRVSPALSDSERRIAEALTQPSDATCAGEPLPEIAKFLHFNQALFNAGASYPQRSVSPAELIKLVKTQRTFREFIIKTSPRVRLSVLGREQLPTWVLTHRLSNLALHCIAEHTTSVSMRDRHELYLWFVNEIAIPTRLPLDLVGDSMVSFLHSDVISGRAVRLSRFFRYTYERGGYAKLYHERNDPVIPFSLDMFLIHAANDHIRPLFGVDMKKFWSETASRTDVGPTRFEVALWTYTASELPAYDVDDPLSDPRLIEVFADHELRALPTLSMLFTPRDAGRARPATAATGTARDTDADSKKRGKVCLIGLRKTETGLGQNFRMFEAALSKMGRLGCVVDCEVSELNVQRFEEDWDTTIFILNAENVPRAFLDCMGKGLIRGKVYGFFLWELETLNELQHTGLACVDEVLVPSEFVRRVYAGATDKPVTNVGKFLFRENEYESAALPDHVRPMLGSSFAFLTAFDSHSGLVRKNPLAVVNAFRRAFPAEEQDDVILLLKTTELLAEHWGDRAGHMEAIIAMAQADPRIRILADRMPFSSYVGMLKSADCVVSASYSEGFGYLMAYAMWFGRPVVTNNYGGVTDFCVEDTSFLVNYTTKPVTAGEFIPQVRDAFWAEIDEAHLAQQMRAVFDDPKTAAQRAEKGKAQLRARYAFDAFCDRLTAALKDTHPG